MENKQKIRKWEEKNNKLVSQIELFYQRYEEENKEKFIRDEFIAHKEMLIFSGKIFKKRINQQVNELCKLNESFLIKGFN